jgi:hypothetical protein
MPTADVRQHLSRTRKGRASFALVLAFLLLSPVLCQNTSPVKAPPPTALVKDSPAGASTITIDHINVALVVAAMSAQIGSIVVVFIAFAIQEMRRIPMNVVAVAESYKLERDKSRLIMLRFNSGIAMAALMLCPVFVAFGAATKVLPVEWIDGLAIALFTFSILNLLLTLIAYLALESPFLHGQ